MQNRDGRWTIPSQYDYPVDGKDQLASIAAAVIALRIDDFASDNVSDHERSGVLDPLDPATTSVSGRGTRVTIRGAHDEIIADVIIGHPVEGHPGLRYIRQPDQRRVYICNVGELKISTALADWIERDLLQVDTEEIDAVNIRYYSIDRGTGSINPGETMLLQKKQEGGWTINGLGANEKLEFQAIDALVKNLANLTITGVLPKPPGITAALSHEANQARVAPGEKADLARKGFYLATNGQLVSDRGPASAAGRCAPGSGPSVWPARCSCRHRCGPAAPLIPRWPAPASTD